MTPTTTGSVGADVTEAPTLAAARAFAKGLEGSWNSVKLEGSCAANDCARGWRGCGAIGERAASYHPTIVPSYRPALPPPTAPLLAPTIVPSFLLRVPLHRPSMSPRSSSRLSMRPGDGATRASAATVLRRALWRPHQSCTRLQLRPQLRRQRRRQHRHRQRHRRRRRERRRGPARSAAAAPPEAVASARSPVAPSLRHCSPAFASWPATAPGPR